MRKRYYDASSIARVLLELERDHGLSSREFFEGYVAGEERDVPRFVQHVWASLYRDYERLSRGRGESDALALAFAR